MDLVEILRQRIDALPAGEYSLGLNAVLQHIRVAVGHHLRGQSGYEESAYTDAIYRTNQAFEGSLKEAFRVLAGRDPDRVTPAKIEEHFQAQGSLRERVLEQFAYYRTRWRNPSTHDYRLDFSEDEALLAIVYVCAFAIVLVDQIIERVSFEAAASTVEPECSNPESALPLVERLASALLRFRFDHNRRVSAAPPRESEIVGALAGYVRGVLPDVAGEADYRIPGDAQFMVDLIFTSDGDHVIVEVKRGQNRLRSILDDGVAQLETYLGLSQAKNGILYLFPLRNEDELVRRDLESTKGGRIIIIGPRQVVMPP